MDGEDFEIDRTSLRKDVLLNSHYGAGSGEKDTQKGRRKERNFVID